MVDDVKKAFEKNLPYLSWMDEETRKAAIDKVRCPSFLKLCNWVHM